MKNIYEVFDEFEDATNDDERLAVIQRNLSKTLHDVLYLTYHPDLQWYYVALPKSYRMKVIPPGMSYCQLSTELRKLYLFQENNSEAQKISEKKRDLLYVEFLESLEPREVEVVLGIFKKDQGVKGLTVEFVKKAFPNMFPQS